MNRENKRKQYEKGYYKNHSCDETFTCKVCGRLVTPNNAGTEHRNHCPNCLSSLHRDIEPGDRDRLRRNYAAYRGVGASKRRVGDYSPMPSLWGVKFQQNSG